MNLPNFFFADLPPEATLSPTMIEAACDTLKRNREKYLLPCSTDKIVKILCEVATEWLQPENKFRKHALDLGPEQTGFSKAIIAKGLDGFFRQFTPESFHALLEQDLGDGIAVTGDKRHVTGEAMAPHHASRITHQFWRGPHFLVHIAAGNLPNPTLMSLTLGLLTRSAQFVKCASGASFLPRLFAHSIYELDHKLGACLELAEWRGGNVTLETALFAEAECVTVTGSDETLAAHRGDVKIWSSQDSTAWTVVFEHEVRFRFSPLNRFIYVKPVPDVAAALQGLDEVHGKVSTVGLAAPPEKMRELARQFARWGATRICPLGLMQNPPLTWRHDGRPALGDLVTWTDFEIEPRMDTDKHG